MDRETLQQAHTAALTAAAHLRLPFRSHTWKGQTGEFAGSGTGSSLDFQDHRAYSPGDDPRHINWQAYARTGSYSMKLFREEVRPVIDLIIDTSESMFFLPAKAIRTAELVYFITESCAAAGASLTTHATRGNAALLLDPDPLRNHTWLDTARHLPAPDPAAAPDLSKVPVRANAIRVFISDLLFPGNPEPILRHLGQRHGTIILLAPFLHSEARPDWSGNFEFIDAERRSRHPHRIDPATLRRYLAAYTAHFTHWKNISRRHHSAFARIPAEQDLSTALHKEAVPTRALEPC
ncbi:MAG: DUF58 domain-containing protein [Verrucomicrobiales bacterium]